MCSSGNGPVGRSPRTALPQRRLVQRRGRVVERAERVPLPPLRPPVPFAHAGGFTRERLQGSPPRCTAARGDEPNLYLQELGAGSHLVRRGDSVVRWPALDVFVMYFDSRGSPIEARSSSVPCGPRKPALTSSRPREPRHKHHRSVGGALSCATRRRVVHRSQSRRPRMISCSRSIAQRIRAPGERVRPSGVVGFIGRAESARVGLRFQGSIHGYRAGDREQHIDDGSRPRCSLSASAWLPEINASTIRAMAGQRHGYTLMTPYPPAARIGSVHRHCQSRSRSPRSAETDLGGLIDVTSSVLRPTMLST